MLMQTFYQLQKMYAYLVGRPAFQFWQFGICDNAIAARIFSMILLNPKFCYFFRLASCNSLIPTKKSKGTIESLVGDLSTPIFNDSKIIFTLHILQLIRWGNSLKLLIQHGYIITINLIRP